MKRILVAIFLAVFLIGCAEKPTAKDVAQSFARAGYEGDADKMISLIHFPDGSAANGSKDMVINKIKNAVVAQKRLADEFGGIDSVVAVNENLESETLSVVTVEVKFKKDQKSKSDVIRLKKVKDEWKIFF